MEIADIYVVNKADRPGVEQTVAEVQSLVEIECSNKERKIPIVQTVAKENKHIDVLVKTIDKHISYLKKTKKLKERRKIRYEAELVEIIRKKLMNFIFNEDQFKETINKLLQKINKKEIDPHSASDLILKDIIRKDL
jgi:LAO/AO transport system kinase